MTSISPQHIDAEDYAHSTSKWQTIQQLNTKLNQQVEEIGEGVKNIIARHEYEYLQAYNIFVKRREFELKQFVL